jgi:hypothetical protein
MPYSKQAHALAEAEGAFIDAIARQRESAVEVGRAMVRVERVTRRQFGPAFTLGLLGAISTAITTGRRLERHRPRALEPTQQ